MQARQDPYRQALAAFRGKQFSQALRLIEQAIVEQPKQVNAVRLKADIHAELGQLEGAFNILHEALRDMELNQKERINLALHCAGIALKNGRISDAKIVLDSCDFSGVGHAQPISQAAYFYSICEDHFSACILYEKACEIQPGDAKLLFNAAAENRAIGELERAEKLYDEVIRIEPEDFEAYKNRTDLRRQTESHNHIEELNAIAALKGLPASGAAQIQFALAKELEDLSEFDRSFHHLQKGAAARRSLIQYTPERDRAVMRLIADESARLGASVDGSLEQSTAGEGLIFILGMPRTGTTLVDRLLSTTPGVYSAGEPDTFARCLTRLCMDSPLVVEKQPDKLALVRASFCIDHAELGRCYELEMQSRGAARGAKVVIDKNPMNFLYLGHIVRALPRARIVHLCRHPVDTCYAIFKTLFRSAYPFSYNLDELADYYIEYRRLMSFWRRALPGKFFDLHYEALVGNPQSITRDLFGYCDLPWDDAVLDFYKNNKQGTATASAAQVRRPVYSSSVGKWKHYAAQLAPLAERLQAAGIEVD